MTSRGEAIRVHRRRDIDAGISNPALLGSLVAARVSSSASPATENQGFSFGGVRVIQVFYYWIPVAASVGGSSSNMYNRQSHFLPGQSACQAEQEEAQASGPKVGIIVLVGYRPRKTINQEPSRLWLCGAPDYLRCGLKDAYPTKKEASNWVLPCLVFGNPVWG